MFFQPNRAKKDMIHRSLDFWNCFFLWISTMESQNQKAKLDGMFIFDTRQVKLNRCLRPPFLPVNQNIGSRFICVCVVGTRDNVCLKALILENVLHTHMMGVKSLDA
eukprot:UN25219